MFRNSWAGCLRRLFRYAWLLVLPAAWVSFKHVPEPGREGMKMLVKIGEYRTTATLEGHGAAAGLAAMLPLAGRMRDVNGNEKYARLPESLPVSAVSPGTVHAGDLMLWGDDGLVLFYETFQTPYRYTRVGRMDDVSGLKAALGEGDVTIVFSLQEK